jgi:hypothetical protein
MTGSGILWDVLRRILQQLPSLLAMLGCMVAALVLWKRHPKVALKVIVSLGLMFLHGLVFAVAYAWVPSWYIKPVTNAAPQFVYTVLSLLYNASMAMILAVLLVAVFMQRQPASQQP